MGMEDTAGTTQWRRARFVVFAVLAAWIAAIVPSTAAKKGSLAANQDSTTEARIAAAISSSMLEGRAVDELRRTGKVSVMVGLERTTGSNVASETPPTSASIATAARTIKALAGRDLTVTQTYEHLPLAAVMVTSEKALIRLLDATPTSGIALNQTYELSTIESLPRIRQPQALATGYDGTGVVMAVLDTGLDYTNPAFGSCPAPGAPGCRVHSVLDVAPDDGSLDNSGHGTLVSAIAVGVAPGAKVIGIDIFAATPGGGLATNSSIIALAINYLVGQKLLGVNVRVLSLSIVASQTYAQGTCPDREGFGVALSQGIQPVAASGNSAYRLVPGTSNRYFTDGISLPACIDGTISVGATHDVNGPPLQYPACESQQVVDSPACFSQTGPNLTVYAPGVSVAAGGLSGSGTSFAAPHVTGAIAVLLQRAPNLRGRNIAELLRNTGPIVTDSRSGPYPVRRLDLNAAIRVVTPAANNTRSTAASLSLAAGPVVVEASTFSNISESRPWNPDGEVLHDSVWYRFMPTQRGALVWTSCFDTTEDGDLVHGYFNVETLDGQAKPVAGLPLQPPSPLCPVAANAQKVEVGSTQPILVNVSWNRAARFRTRFEFVPTTQVNDSRTAAIPVSQDLIELVGATKDRTPPYSRSRGANVWYLGQPDVSYSVSSAALCLPFNGCSEDSPRSDSGFYLAAWSGDTLVGYDEGGGFDSAKVGPFSVPVDLEVGTLQMDEPFVGSFSDVPLSQDIVGDSPLVPIAMGLIPSNHRATGEPGIMIGSAPAQRSVWASWTAPATGRYVVAASGGFQPRLSAWVSRNPFSTPATCRADAAFERNTAECVFFARSGDEVLVGLDGMGGQHGWAQLGVTQLDTEPREPVAVAPRPTTTVPRGVPGRTPAAPPATRQPPGSVPAR
jgi:subtilisin family serine protease